MAEFGTLTVDERLYIQATRVLGRLEGGEDYFDIWTACRTFIEEPYLHERFERETGREWREERAVARGFVGGVIMPEHHNLYLEEYEQDVEDLDQPAADFIRAAMWSFLTAWTHRYGGFHPDIRKRGTLVDPRLRDPDRRAA